jgi:hypothetical protein
MQGAQAQASAYESSGRNIASGITNAAQAFTTYIENSRIQKAEKERQNMAAQLIAENFGIDYKDALTGVKGIGAEASIQMFAGVQQQQRMQRNMQFLDQAFAVNTTPEGEVDVAGAIQSFSEMGGSPSEAIPFIQQGIESGVIRPMSDGPKPIKISAEDFPDWAEKQKKAGNDYTITGQDRSGDFYVKDISPLAGPSTVLNMGGELTPIEKGLQEADIAMVNKLGESAASAEEQNSVYSEMLPLIGNTYSGIGGDLVVKGKQVVRALGGNPDGLEEGEILRALGNQLALRLRNPDSGMGLTGNTSDRDVKFLKDSVPNIEKSPEGNRKLIEIAVRINQRKVEKAEMAKNYIRQNGSMDGFNKKWKEYLDMPENDIFYGMSPGDPPATPSPSQAQGGNYNVIEFLKQNNIPLD